MPTTKQLAAEAARLALFGATVLSADAAEQQPHETPADHAARLVLAGGHYEFRARLEAERAEVTE